jgi:hypothetical protein
MRFSNSLNTLVAILAASVVGALAASIESPTPGTILFDGENFDFKFQGTRKSPLFPMILEPVLISPCSPVGQRCCYRWYPSYYRR